MNIFSPATHRIGLAAAVALMGLLCALPPAASAAAPGAGQTAPQSVGRAQLTPSPAIVNGDPIPIQDAPWQTYVQSDMGPASVACGGSILDATHVVTAAHCVYDDAQNLRPVSTFTVVAGVSNVRAAAPGDAPQLVRVSSVRAHPLYDPAATSTTSVSADDVAVLQLAAPLVLGLPTAQAIPLAAGPSPAVGTAASLTGFGRQAAGGVPDGQLYEVGTGVVNPMICGGANNAILLCVSSSVGSACQGDSGGPMTVGTPAMLVGVTSFVTLSGPSGECGVASLNGYTNVTAPEISAFIAGDDSPPLAPRGGLDIRLSGIFQVGRTATCTAGTWSNNPTIQYTFQDSAGVALQSGASSTYTFAPADAGRAVACHVSATTDGGTGISMTGTSAPVASAPVAPSPPRPAPRPAPKPKPVPPTSAKARLSVSVTLAKQTVRSGGTVRFTIRVSNRGRAAAKRVVVCNTPGSGLAFGHTPKGAERSRGRACWIIARVRANSGRTLQGTLRATRTERIRTVTVKAGARARNAAVRRDTARIVVQAAQRPAPTPPVTG
ncbi:MAG TPA: trypsin-like serine protease [Conexibacter sp.]|nr:trypsin-like serine protease [Conexibacter sp.]